LGDKGVKEEREGDEEVSVGEEIEDGGVKEERMSSILLVT